MYNIYMKYFLELFHLQSVFCYWLHVWNRDFFSILHKLWIEIIMHVRKKVKRQSILTVLHTSTPILHAPPSQRNTHTIFIIIITTIIIMYLGYTTTWKWPSGFRVLLLWTQYSPKHISFHKEAAPCPLTAYQLGTHPTSYSTTLSRFWRMKCLTNFFPALLCNLWYILSWELQRS